MDKLTLPASPATTPDSRTLFELIVAEVEPLYVLLFTTKPEATVTAAAVTVSAKFVDALGS